MNIINKNLHKKMILFSGYYLHNILDSPFNYTLLSMYPFCILVL